MAIPHAESGQLIDLNAPADAPARALSHALFKTRDLEVMRLAIPAGRSVPPHHVSGDLTMQCLQGEVELIAAGQPRRLQAGHLLWLTGGVEYAITGMEDASLLVTVALCHEGEHSTTQK